MSSATAFVSRSFARLSKEELAEKRDRLRRANMPGQDRVADLDSLRGLSIVDNAGTIVHSATGTPVAPAQPARLRFVVSAPTDVEDRLLETAPHATWTGPYNLRETFIITAWFSSLYGGWNFTSQRAIGAWNYFGKPGSAERSEGDDFDAALAKTSFGSSDGLADSGALSPGLVYFFETTTTAGSRLAAHQDEHHQTQIVHVVDALTGETVTLEEGGPLAELDTARPATLEDRPFRVEEVAELVSSQQPPFSRGIGAYYTVRATGERVEFVNAVYQGVVSSYYDANASLLSLWLAGSEDQRAILSALFPEEVKRLASSGDELAALADWVADFNSNKYSETRFGARSPSKQMIALAHRFPRGVASATVLASMRKDQPTGLRLMLKALRHWTRLETEAH